MAPQSSTTGAQAIARVFWMMLGPLLLLVLGFSIANRGGGWLTGMDLAFFAALALMGLARVVEFRGPNPQTATGDPATPADLQRFLTMIALLGLGAWVVANLVGNHVVGG